MDRICVFCGANSGERPEYEAAASELGKLLAENGLGIVYGGTNTGLMGKLADAALKAKGEVIGVLPSALAEKEIAHTGLTELHIVETTEDRKRKMFELSQGFIVLPGGLGTLDEISEMLSWGQLGYHDKPIALLNISGYFDHLLDFLLHAVKEQLIRQRHLDLLKVVDFPGNLLNIFAPNNGNGNLAPLR